MVLVLALFLLLAVAALGTWVYMESRPVPLTPLPPLESLTYQDILDWSLANGMPGVVLLVKSPQEDFVGSAGWADRKQQVPMRVDHAFRVASTTKLFLGMVAAQMHVEGLLDTSQPITHYLPPEITRRIANSDRITVRQLVRHTSGIFNYTESLVYQFRAYCWDPRGDWAPRHLLEYALDEPPYFNPGEGFRYSNTNFVLLGMILDRVAGHHHSQEIRKRFLDPLHMTSTWYEGYESPHGELAHGLESFAGFTIDTFDWTAERGGDGGIISTVGDLAAFVRAVAGTGTFLNEATKKLIKSDPPTNDKDRPWYPLLHYDFGMSRTRGTGNPDVPVEIAPLFFGHGGATPGYVCFAMHEPKNDITAVYFGASHLLGLDQTRIDRFLAHVGDAIFGLAVKHAQQPASSPGTPRTE